MECYVLTSRTQQFNMPPERASWYVLRRAICSLSEATSGCVASAGPHRSLDLQWWAIPPYFCLIRGDVICKLIAPFVIYSALDAQVQACLSSCINKSNKAIDYTSV